MPVETLDVAPMTALADEAIAVPEGEHDRFIELVDVYLAAFELFVAEATDLRSRIGEEKFSVHKPALEQLYALHQQLQDRSEQARAAVTGELGGLRRRSTILRSYIDTLPDRISIVGKVKG